MKKLSKIIQTVAILMIIFIFLVYKEIIPLSVLDIIKNIVMILGIIFIITVSIIIFKFIFYKCYKIIYQFLQERKYKRGMNVLKSTEEFDNIYNNICKQNYDELEYRRKTYRKKQIIQYCFLGCLILNISIIPFLDKLSPENLYWILLTVPLFCILWFICLGDIYKYVESYKTYYKENIIKSFLNYISKSFKYKYCYEDFEQQEIDNVKKSYKIANFDNNQNTDIYYDDYIECYLQDNVYIQMADIVDLSNKFKGIFVSSVSNINIVDSIHIVKNQTQIDKSAKILLDNQKFEEYFNVFADNKINAMQFLTSDVMELIMDFYKMFNLKFELVLNQNKIYIRFLSGNLFEPKIFISPIEKKNLFKCYQILKFVTELTIIINKTLNQSNI